MNFVIDILLLRKGVYPYEYMDSWKRFDETALPNKKQFYRKLILTLTCIKYLCNFTA